MSGSAGWRLAARLLAGWLPAGWLGLWACTAPSPAQEPLQFEAEPPHLAEFVAAATAALAACHEAGTGPVDAQRRALEPAEATGPLLAWLWLRRDEQSRDILRRERAASARDAGEAGWIVLHHYWYLRATHDAATIRAHAALLAACAEQLTAPRRSPDLEPPDLEAEVLRLHAVACCGGLLDSLDRIEQPQAWAQGPRQPAPGASFARQALALLASLERRHWREDAGRFGDEATAANLLPCWIGALAATGDKTQRNATAALRLLTASASCEHALPRAMAVVAAAQFEQDCSPWLQPLLAALEPIATRTPANSSAAEQRALGAAVDAVLFLVTGVRMATGPGVDEDWLRLRPRLPPGGLRVAVRGVRHDACTADLWLDRRTGTPTAAEQEVLRRCGAPEAAVGTEAGGAAQWLQGAVAVRTADPASVRVTVVHTAGRQLVARVRSDDVLEFASLEPGPATGPPAGPSPTGSSGRAPRAR